MSALGWGFIFMENSSSEKSGLDSPKREKDWGEITTDEKVERMRQVVKNISSQCYRLQRKVDVLESIVRGHKHQEDGVVVPVGLVSESSFCTGEISVHGKEYF